MKCMAIHTRVLLPQGSDIKACDCECDTLEVRYRWFRKLC